RLPRHGHVQAERKPAAGHPGGREGAGDGAQAAQRDDFPQSDVRGARRRGARQVAAPQGDRERSGVRTGERRAQAAPEPAGRAIQGWLSQPPAEEVTERTKMNGEGQRPPAPPEPAQVAADAPEPGNARYPQPGMNGNGQLGQSQGQGQGQEGQGGGGRRRFRRNRRGGRGRRGKGGHGQNQVAAPLDAQGRIVDVENDPGEDAGGEEAQADGNVAQAQPPPPQQSVEGQAPGNEAAPAGDGAQPQPQGQQQGQQGQQQGRQQQQPRHEPAQPVDGVLDVDHRGNGRLRSPKYNFLPQQDDPDVPRHIIDRDRLR